MTTSRQSGFLPTRHTLLNRLRDLGDDASWKEFFDTYWKLIYAVALKSGLREAEAEDVVQETVIAVTKTIEKYQYDSNVTFKGWLRHLIRARVADHYRRQGRRERLLDDASGGEGITGSAIDQVADPAAQVLDAIWEEEWQRNLIDAAMERLKPQVSVKQYQVFYLHAIKGQPAKEVARTMNVSVAYVHLTRHRLQPLFRKAVERIERNEGK